MLELVGERVGGWCGRDANGSLRQAVRARRRPHQDIYAKVEADVASRASALYRVKSEPSVPAPQPQSRPVVGLACSRCAPISRESWQDPQAANSNLVINVRDIPKNAYDESGLLARCFIDLVQVLGMYVPTFKDLVPKVVKDEGYQKAIEETTQAELRKLQEKSGNNGGESEYARLYPMVRQRVELRALKVLTNMKSVVRKTVVRMGSYAVHKALARIAVGGVGTRLQCVQRLKRANAAGVPLVFVSLHRSHFDYLLISYVLLLNGVRPPFVAAGDNMNIPLFGAFLRSCGGFFIKRNTDGNYKADAIYHAALRAYILNSLGECNNLELFIEGGRSRTGKPQLPKAGILSVILEAYMEGTIDDALLVPTTLNYERLVDGNYVREELGMPKKMESFWAAVKGIWRTLNTNFGSIRVDFNQPISLKELVASFQKYSYLKPPERPLSPLPKNLATLDLQMLYKRSHSSLFEVDVRTDHKIMVEAIGRHLVYDAAVGTPLMSTYMIAYELLTTHRAGCTLSQLSQTVGARGAALVRVGRDLGYTGEDEHVVKHALNMLRDLVKREGTGDKMIVKPLNTIPALVELSYYANAVVTHYAPTAIIVTALESILRSPNADQDEVSQYDLMEAGLQLCSVLTREFILCPPCQRTEERLWDAIDELKAEDIISSVQSDAGIEEQKWSRRFAKNFEDEDEEVDPSRHIKYTISKRSEAVAERRRLLMTLRPVLEAYAATCNSLREGSLRGLVKDTLATLTESYNKRNIIYGEAISNTAVRNCISLLRQWGVIEMFSDNKDKIIRINPPYDEKQNFDSVLLSIRKYNMDTPLLNEI